MSSHSLNKFLPLCTWYVHANVYCSSQEFPSASATAATLATVRAPSLVSTASDLISSFPTVPTTSGYYGDRIYFSWDLILLVRCLQNFRVDMVSNNMWFLWYWVDIAIGQKLLSMMNLAPWQVLCPRLLALSVVHFLSQGTCWRGASAHSVL